LSTNRSALGDIRLRFWMGLIGTPALTPRQFAVHKRQLAFGTSFTLAAPTGQYDSAKRVNVGSNRWSVKPELGLSYPTGRWTLEGAAGIWFYTTNNEFFGRAQLQQDPLGTFQLHVEYTFRPGLWLGASGTYFVGGRTSLNGVEQDTEKKNTRLGLTLSLPIRKGQSVKLAWSQGLTTLRGGDFTTIAVAWQHVWF
jgi:hypothetical protein